MVSIGMERKKMVSLGREKNKIDDRLIAILSNFVAILQTNLAELKSLNFRNCGHYYFKLAQAGLD
tara:strand:- start:1708 stop:1902 length:195 start_codon:yes stop_codon:yes gene_type:complete